MKKLPGDLFDKDFRTTFIITAKADDYQTPQAMRFANEARRFLKNLDLTQVKALRDLFPRSETGAYFLNRLSAWNIRDLQSLIKSGYNARVYALTKALAEDLTEKIKGFKLSPDCR